MPNTDIKHGMGSLLTGNLFGEWSLYEGHFKQSLRDGYGRFIDAGGQTYDGYWRQNCYWGEGTLTFEDDD